METLCQIIQKIKKTNIGWEELFTQLAPLIHGYTKKLYFLEPDDAKQEIYIAIFKAVQSMTYIRSDGECLNYIRNGIHYAYTNLCEKAFHMPETVSFEESYCSLETLSLDNPFHDLEIHIEFRNFIKTLSPRKKRIFEYILQGFTDSEIAEKLSVSRQYINRVKHELIHDPKKKDIFTWL